MQKILVIAGPTASGKTALSIELAQRLNGEILSADSRQIYCRCDIVTAKPTRQEQRQAPHHLLDICQPDEPFSAAQWAHMARETIAQIQARNRVAIVVGGTGFYLRALLEPERLPASVANPQLRAQLETQLQERGALAMWQHLQVLAPERAAKFHPNDHYRVVRALEIALSPVQQTVGNEDFPHYETLNFALDWPRELLYERIESRVEAMIEMGAWDELRALIQSGIAPDAPALSGVGYAQMWPALHDFSQQEAAAAQWKQASRRYAKRQTTWFAHQLEAQTLDATQTMGAMSETIEAKWRAG